MSSLYNLILNVISKIFSKNTFSNFDKQSYEALVRCLSLSDDLAVNEAIKQLVQEENYLAIPPLYLAFKSHPNSIARKHCYSGLVALCPDRSFEKIVQGKSVNESVEALIEHYGNFRYDY